MPAIQDPSGRLTILPSVPHPERPGLRKLAEVAVDAMVEHATLMQEQGVTLEWEEERAELVNLIAARMTDALLLPPRAAQALADGVVAPVVVQGGLGAPSGAQSGVVADPGGTDA